MDLSPVVNTIIGIAAPLVTAAVVAAAKFIFDKVGFDKDTALRNSFLTAVQNGIGKALTQGQIAADTAVSNIQIGSPAVRAVLEYANANAPQYAAHFKLDEGQVEEKVQAQIALWLHERPQPAKVVVEQKPAGNTSGNAMVETGGGGGTPSLFQSQPIPVDIGKGPNSA